MHTGHILCKRAAELDVDAVALAPHSKTKLQTFFLGSVANYGTSSWIMYSSMTCCISSACVISLCAQSRTTAPSPCCWHTKTGSDIYAIAAHAIPLLHMCAIQCAHKKWTVSKYQFPPSCAPKSSLVNMANSNSPSAFPQSSPHYDDKGSSMRDVCGARLTSS